MSKDNVIDFEGVRPTDQFEVALLHLDSLRRPQMEPLQL